MHLNDFRRTLIPGDEVHFFNLKRYVTGKVKAVNGTVVTIDVDEDGEVKTYHQHRKYLNPPMETASWFESYYSG